MKNRYALSAVPLLFLVIVIVLATGGITMNWWAYVILAIVCPVAAGIIWYIYKSTEKKQ